MNLISAIVHVHYGDCYHNKSEKVQVQGTTVVAGAAETEYTGERKVLLEDIKSINRSGQHSMEKFYTQSPRTTKFCNIRQIYCSLRTFSKVA